MGAHGKRRRFDRTVYVAAAFLTVASAGPARADAGVSIDVVTWPTYFRTGPGNHFVVMQELSRGTQVEVRSCARDWCEVRVGRVVGFVDQANVGPDAPPSVFPAQGQNTAGCFDSRRAGYKKGEVFRYCPRSSQPD